MFYPILMADGGFSTISELPLIGIVVILYFISVIVFLPCIAFKYLLDFIFWMIFEALLCVGKISKDESERKLTKYLNFFSLEKILYCFFPIFIVSSILFSILRGEETPFGMSQVDIEILVIMLTFCYVVPFFGKRFVKEKKTRTLCVGIYCGFSALIICSLLLSSL
ncbi:hypothetical protein [Intestinicryptomonas porci]|uniref:Uncharacterized protein n=1 Tax=Intestinicryptomonas porci TaxID=2926320 RepID=A0ABU4WIM3_9BACT|nr:hypothetical protein [Opitutales bacterium CLA-KB-P66]